MSNEIKNVKDIVKTILEMKPNEVWKYTYRADVDTFLTDYNSMIRDICPSITNEEIISVLDELARQMIHEERSNV